MNGFTVGHEIPGVLWRRDPAARRCRWSSIRRIAARSIPRISPSAARSTVLRRAEDAYVDELFEAAPAHGATMIARGVSAQLSRRQPRRRRSRPGPSRRRRGRSICRCGRRRGSGWCGAMLRPACRSMTASCIPTKCWRGSSAITRRITRRSTRPATGCTAQFGAVWHVNCHSMPSTGSRKHGRKGEHGDFVLGDRDGTTCGAGIHRFRRHDAARHGLRGPYQRRLQGGRDRAPPGPPARAPPQSADRGRPLALYGSAQPRKAAGFRRAEGRS